MAFFGFKSSKEVEAEKQQAAAEAARRVEQNNYVNLSNLSKGSQINFAIPYFDVFDPRLTDFGVPVSVHGSIAYAIEDLDLFQNINRNEGFSDETFKDKLRGTVTKFVKGVVSNAPSDAQIPVVQLERKIMEISSLVEQYVIPRIEKTFGITVRSLDVTSINVDKDSRGFRELRALTADLERERTMARHNADLSNFNMQNSLNQDQLKTQSALNLDAMRRQHEMQFGGNEEMQRIQLENQRETMRIQREEMQRASKLQTEQTFMGAHQANLNAGIANNAINSGIGNFQSSTASFGTPNMGGMNAMNPMGAAQQAPGFGAPTMPGMPGMKSAMPQTPQVSYMVGVNGQQAGPFNWQQLQQLAQQGQLTRQTYVWTEGMPQWAFAGEVAELSPLFAGAMPSMPGMPPMGGLR